jgi:hypothetical protein
MATLRADRGLCKSARRATAASRGPCTASVALAAVFLVVGIIALPARAQFPDAVSDTECPGCAESYLAAAQAIAGTWSSPLTSSGDSLWPLEELFCYVACTPDASASAAAKLADPGNARRPLIELLPTIAFGCDPLGLAAQIVSPLPIVIKQQPGRVVFRYEEFGVERAVYLNEHRTTAAAPARTMEPATPADLATPFGISRGYFDGRALVVETRAISAGRYHAWFGGGAHGDRLRTTERYTASADGQWLTLVLVLDEPETLREPLVVTKRWRRTPHVTIVPHRCDAMSGQLEGVVAEYFDPASLDARR